MASFHTRSNSLPSRPHPVISELDEHMSRLRDSQPTSTSSPSSSIGNKLISLQDLHDCVDKLLLLPLIQQVLAQEDNRNQVDYELLDGSLRILDLCNITKDALSQTKDCIQQLQSVFRRRQDSLESEIKKYISSRKIVKKTIKKVLKNLKSSENKSVSSSSEILTAMREVEAITLNTFKSVLSFVSSNTKPKGWSLVSRLMHQKKVACEEQETNENEFQIVDAALDSIIGCKSRKLDDLEDVQKKFQNLELCIQHLEDATECLFRKMIKSRATFLNIFN